ncbi:MAG: xylulokinase [Gaiellaceae bacterium]
MTEPATADGICLAVDLGTGGPKVGFVRLNGEILWDEHQLVETRWLPGGGATQDAGAWWDVICAATRRGIASGTIPADEVVAVACTGQWASTVPVDEGGEPVGDCILWMDSRGGAYSQTVIGGPVAGYSLRRALHWVRKTGGAPSPTGNDPIGHMLYLQHAEPEVAARARWFLEPVDYLTLRFSGVASASHASMIAGWLTDNRHLDRLEYDEALIALSGVDATKLAPLVATGSVVGTVLPDVARALGIPETARVVNGVPDLHSAACGAGAIGDFEAHMAISTSSWIGAPVPFKKTDARRSIASLPGLSSNRYLIANNHESGGLCLQWLRDTLFPAGSFDELTQLAATASPGAGNVIFTPWLNGERSPVDDRNARAGFHNVSVNTRPEDLVRAVLEGVAYNDRWLYEAVESFAKRRLDPIRIVGGGSQSDLWCQIHADVLDRVVERVGDSVNAHLRGAAIFAGLSLGALSTTEVRDAVPVETTFRPDAATRDLYDRLYAEFPRLYKSQRGMFARLNAVGLQERSAARPASRPTGSPTRGEQPNNG